MTTPLDGCKVGYGRPPLKTRWKKGQSGNPRKKPKRQESALDIIDRLLLSPTELTLNGEHVTVSNLQAVLLQLQQKELSGSARASRILLKYREFASRTAERRLEVVFVDNEYPHLSRHE
jgi:hypothetical protein